MGRITIAAFEPHDGREAELLQVIRDRLPLLRRLGLATDRAEMTLRSRTGVIISISEWVDEDAIRRAHETPEVLELWSRFDACSSYRELETLPECAEEFATFEAL